VQHAILDDLHTIMYMPIKLNESIEAFMTRGRNKIIESFTQHLPDDSWTQYFFIFELVIEITFNPLLLFHHVVHIPKY
jgi:hypothetical protein